MKCSYCAKEFERKKSLTNHRRWHNLPQYNKFQKKFREYMSNFQMGNKYNLGYEMKEETKKKIGAKNSGENHGLWKGNKVGYTSLHEWIKNHKSKSEFCENCKINLSYDLANISGEYKRDINDFEWLCRKCHMTKDGRIVKLQNGKM